MAVVAVVAAAGQVALLGQGALPVVGGCMAAVGQTVLVEVHRGWQRVV